MKTLAGKKDSPNTANSTAKTASPKAAESIPNPEGISMMRELLRHGSIAAKLKIGSPSDPAEIEADRVADAVVNNTGHAISFRENRAPIAKKNGAGPRESGSPPGSSIYSGNPRGLNPAEQGYFEQRFNQDFSRIRIHEGASASNAASSINARAFTHGSDIYLKRGEYSFGSTDGNRLMAHELAHTLQPDNGSIRRWGGSEHLAFGNIAGGMVADHHGDYMKALFKLTDSRENAMQTRVMQTSALQISAGRKIKGKEKKVRKGHDEASTQSMYIPYKHVYPLAEYKRQMLLGTATELSGDHRKSAQDLAASSYDNTKLTDYALGGYDPKYLMLAQTNFNHFFPLAVKEWLMNHGTAMQTAFVANIMFRAAATDPENCVTYMLSGNNLLKKAIQHETFGLHFLQDAFASGHQYPRAFDRTQPTEFFLAKTTMGGSRSRTEHRTVHSFSEVNRLKGLGWRLTGTGDKSTGHKARIYHDLLCELAQGIHLKHRGKSQRFHGDGTGDSTDYPVAVETYNSMAEVLCMAFSAKMTDVGALTPLAPEGPDIPEIMDDKIAAPIWFAMEKDLANNFDANIGNPDTDKAHKTDSGMVSFSHDSVMKDWNRIHAGKGSVVETHEQPEGADFYIKGVGDPSLLFTAQDDNIVAYLKKNTFPSTVSPNICAYIINLLIDGVCGDGDEGAILKILKVQSDDNFFKIVFNVGIPRLDEGIDGGEWTQLLYMIQRRIQKGAASSDIATKLIKGLIATECWDQEEKLIITAVLLLNNSDCSALLKVIDLKKFDSGIDGAEWDKFLSVIMSKLPKEENDGAEQIAREKNDDAARRAVTRLWAYGYKIIGEHVSPRECIGLIKALLSGSCGDDDEDAIVLIVAYMVDNGQKDLIEKIGEDTMDSGVDGEQWTKVAYLMGWN